MFGMPFNISLPNSTPFIEWRVGFDWSFMGVEFYEEKI